MSIRAKVRIENVQAIDCYLNDGTPAKGASVVMRPVYDNAPENKSWSEATPSGEFSMCITNPGAASLFLETDEFKEGAELYVDFTPVQQDAV